MAETEITEGILFGMGNPLLDISATSDESFLQRYGLKADCAILAEEKHLPIFDEMIRKYVCDYIAGGATQNSIRTAQWLLRVPKATTYIGCVGTDNFASLLSEAAMKEGLRVNYLQTPYYQTGTCAVLLTGKNRSLVANLGAAEHYRKEHLMEAENWQWIEKAKYFYTSGYFLIVSPESMLEVARHSRDHGKIFCTNLSAPYLVTSFKERMMAVFPYVDILFGNEDEFSTFAEEHSLGTKDLREVSRKIAAMPKENSNYSRIVIITQGENPVIVARDGVSTEYAVPHLDQEKVVDSNGAGDAFVGGFLSQLVQNKPIEECVRCAIYAAGVIIQRSGITFPPKPDFKPM